MQAINIVMNIAKLMLIFNGLNVSLNTVDATISSSSSTSIVNPHDVELMEGTSKVSGVAVVGTTDILNIRHERSKQRRHSTSTDREQQLQQPQHLTKTLYENSSGNKELQLQHKTDDQKAIIIRNIDEELTKQELKQFSTNFHSSHGNDENAGVHTNSQLDTDGLVIATDIDVVNNVTKHLNNANDVTVAKGIGISTSIIHSMFQATMATHHLTPSAPVPTTTLKAVTHKIRKLHKKKIVESLRQLNIDKFNINGDHLTKNHHRSLQEAEQLQQQAQLQDTNKNIPNTPDDSQQLQQQQQIATVASIDDANSSSHQVAKVEGKVVLNGDKADMFTNDIDTNESVNDGDLPDTMEKYKGVDDDVNEEHEEDNDDDDDLSDVFYQNDENVSNVNGDEDDDDNDEAVDDEADVLYATTLHSLLDDKFVKQFKNFSSEFIKDIDNNVDSDDNDTENENLLTSWQDIKDLKFKPLNLSSTSSTYSLLTTANLIINSTEDSSNTSITTKFPYDFSFSSEEHPIEPLHSASTSQGSIHFEHHQSSFYDKEEINFNYSSDLAPDEASSSKDLIMDEAVMEDSDDNNGHANGFPLSNLDESDSDTDTETEGLSEVNGDDETNHFLEGVVDAANSEETYDWDEISRSNRRDLMHGRDVVTKFLQIVETQHSLGSNCEAGTSLNLGEGVVDRYAQDRFRIEAEVAVNRANMLTR